MRATIILMPAVGDQIAMGYTMVVDPEEAKIPGRAPVFQGDDFSHAIGWAENIRVDDGRIVGEIELDPAYQDHVVPGLDWASSTEGTTLWGVSLFPAVRGVDDA